MTNLENAIKCLERAKKFSEHYGNGSKEVAYDYLESAIEYIEKAMNDFKRFSYRDSEPKSNEDLDILMINVEKEFNVDIDYDTDRFITSQPLNESLAYEIKIWAEDALQTITGRRRNRDIEIEVVEHTAQGDEYWKEEPVYRVYFKLKK